ncbi:multidrug effflux MFS transporter [Halovulum sp. GXIMD14793]
MPFVLAGCTAVSVLSTDLLTPSIPSLPDALDTDIRMAQLVVGINLAAYSIAQLIHGPLADRIGRRGLLLWAFPLFVIVSAACTFSTSINALLAGRFLQGLFSSVPSVVVVLIIRELYGSRQAMQVMALYGAVMGVAPAIGPLIGGQLQAWFGWTASFWTIAGLALLALLAFWRWVPETLPPDRERPAGNPFAQYRQLLGQPVFLRTALALSLTFGAFFAYVSTAPVVFIDRLGVSEQVYGVTYLPVICAFIIGNVLCSKLSNHWDGVAIVYMSMRLMVIGIGLLLLPLVFGYETVLSLLLPMLVYAAGFAMMMAAGQIVVLDQARDMPQGAASAVLGALQLGAAAAAGAVSSLSYHGGGLTMALTMAGFVGTGALLLVSVRLKAFQDKPETQAYPETQ